MNKKLRRTLILTLIALLFTTAGILGWNWYYFHVSDPAGEALSSRETQPIETTQAPEETAPLFTGWLEQEGTRCYFGSDGVMVTGWNEIDGIRYYFAEDGSLATGWKEIDEKHYYFQEDGTPYTGWLQEGEYRYYLLEDGSAAVGPMEIDGQTYYFGPQGIHIWLVNPWNYIHEDYEVELVTAEAGYRVAEVCQEALLAMIADCRAAGHSPVLCSGYRSYWDQKALYDAQVEKYGPTYAKTSVAVPNTSEHQLGLAVDIVSGSYARLDAAQGNTKVQQWLMEHCWEYGFILRYPDGSSDITGIIYEPWHYRYVGTEVSLELQELGITLEEYVGAATTDTTTEE